MLFFLALDVLLGVMIAALRTTSLSRLFHLRELDHPGAGQALELVEAMPRPYAALYLARMIARLAVLVTAIGVLLAGKSAPTFGWSEAAWVLLSVLLLGWLEWGVERRAARRPETLLIRLVKGIRAVDALFSPLAAVNLWLSGEHKADAAARAKVTEDDLLVMMDVGQQDGVIEQDESKMIQSIFQLGDTLTREIMVPRVDIRALEIGIPLDEAVDFLLQTGHSRLPVYAETIDNILGVLYAKDLLRVWRERSEQTVLHAGLLREAYFVPEAKKVDELLDELQRLRVHMAIVVDEYGGVAGLVTLEDIIEEIVGEIRDEYDEQEELPFVEVGEGEYLFRGLIDLDDFNEVMGTHLPNDEADTLGGYIYTRLGHIPEPGERIREDGLEITVEHVSEHRILKVRARRVWEEVPASEEG